MSVRIIAGEYRGRVLKCLDSLEVRPTSSMARAAIFNVAQTRGNFARVLDLYSGCGALGIEAVSRGSGRATLVEKDGKSCAIIRENIEKLKLGRQVSLHQGDALEYARNCGQSYDLILADPPYPDRCLADILAAVEDGKVLNEFGILALQHSVKENPLDEHGSLSIWKNKTYGKTQVSFYCHKGER